MSFQSEEYRRNISLDRCSTASIELFVPLIVLKISQEQALIKNKDRETRKYFPTKQISQEKIDHLIIVIPTWKTQLWYSQLLEISVQPPFRLPQIRNLLANPQGKNHLLVETRSLRLAFRLGFQESLQMEGISRNTVKLMSYSTRNGSATNYELDWAQ